MNYKLIYLSLIIQCCNIISISSQIIFSEKFPELFQEVQTNEVFSDQKHFVDCLPKFHPDTIQKEYTEQKGNSDFILKDFVGRKFDTNMIDTSSIFKHIDNLWNQLSRQPEKQNENSSLITLPESYVVPGGRFREIYYWDSYFTMLGLKVSGKYDLIEDMVNNFAFLIDQYGFVPNGNRTYYLSRSQPPFFSLMVELLAQIKGEDTYIKYLPQLEKEYNFWMDGVGQLKAEITSIKKVVLIENEEVLNRYCDTENKPRSESYIQDMEVYLSSDKKPDIYNQLRSAAESGWDFSSRWLADTLSLHTIQTTNIIPVDLNSLLYNLEKVLSKSYELKGDNVNKKKYLGASRKRKELVMKYCYDNETGYFFDFNFVDNKQTGIATLAGIYPLYFNMVENEYALKTLQFMKVKFLMPGGLVTSNYNTGQQWDYPNGWAPLQYLGYISCKNYEDLEFAHQIAHRWTDLNIKVYEETGKMLEKYNVVDINLPGGGGEYPLQDGFGWTNGVFLKLMLEMGNAK